MSNNGLLPGSIFAHDFKIVKLLSKGGQGDVYVVQQISTRRKRALKVLHGHLAWDQRQLAQFLQEATCCSLIESDHVVEVIAAGIDATTKSAWLVMELLVGKDLEQTLAERPVLTLPTVRQIFAHLGHALGLAHRLGLVHRDIKPSNIFLAAPRHYGVDFTVKLLDFGIAKFVPSVTRGQATAVLKSPHNTFAGTAGWMAPEQITQSEISPATDVWALGLLAFRLLFGKEYWVGAESSANALMRESLGGAVDPASVRARALASSGPIPPGFDSWFARCVSAQPELRFKNAVAAVEGLDLVFG